MPYICRSWTALLCTGVPKSRVPSPWARSICSLPSSWRNRSNAFNHFALAGRSFEYPHGQNYLAWSFLKLFGIMLIYLREHSGWKLGATLALAVILISNA